MAKIYYARLDGPLTEEDVSAFAKGLHIEDADGTFDAKPAKLWIETASPEGSTARVQVTEGRYHQVKRMYASRGVHVTYLRREKIGALALDESLKPGEWREITEEEAALLEKDPEE